MSNTGTNHSSASSNFYQLLGVYGKSVQDKKYIIAEEEDAIENIKIRLQESCQLRDELRDEVIKLESYVKVAESEYSAGFFKKSKIQADIEESKKVLNVVRAEKKRLQDKLNNCKTGRQKQNQAMTAMKEDYMAKYMKIPHIREYILVAERHKILTTSLNRNREHLNEYQQLWDARLQDSSKNWSTFVLICVKTAENLKMLEGKNKRLQMTLKMKEKLMEKLNFNHQQKCQVLQRQQKEQLELDCEQIGQELECPQIYQAIHSVPCQVKNQQRLECQESEHSIQREKDKEELHCQQTGQMIMGQQQESDERCCQSLKRCNGVDKSRVFSALNAVSTSTVNKSALLQNVSHSVVRNLKNLTNSNPFARTAFASPNLKSLRNINPFTRKSGLGTVLNRTPSANNSTIRQKSNFAESASSSVSKANENNCFKVPSPPLEKPRKNFESEINLNSDATFLKRRMSAKKSMSEEKSNHSKSASSSVSNVNVEQSFITPSPPLKKSRKHFESEISLNSQGTPLTQTVTAKNNMVQQTSNHAEYIESSVSTANIEPSFKTPSPAVKYPRINFTSGMNVDSEGTCFKRTLPATNSMIEQKSNPLKSVTLPVSYADVQNSFKTPSPVSKQPPKCFESEINLNTQATLAKRTLSAQNDMTENHTNHGESVFSLVENVNTQCCFETPFSPSLKNPRIDFASRIDWDSATPWCISPNLNLFGSPTSTCSDSHSSFTTGDIGFIESRYFENSAYDGSAMRFLGLSPLNERNRQLSPNCLF